MLGNKIKEFRKLRDITQVQLAERIGVTNAYISMLESSERTNVSLDLLKAIASALAVPVSQLLQ
jgi:transcriptional regulator with XRE-family HTH domain